MANAPVRADEYEIRTQWAELIVESVDPILMHGLLLEDKVSVEKILAVLRHARVSYEGEVYNEDREMLDEFSWKPT